LPSFNRLTLAYKKKLTWLGIRYRCRCSMGSDYKSEMEAIACIATTAG
jgi:hypothetical protein